MARRVLILDGSSRNPYALAVGALLTQSEAVAVVQVWSAQTNWIGNLPDDDGAARAPGVQMRLLPCRPPGVMPRVLNNARVLLLLVSATLCRSLVILTFPTRPWLTLARFFSRLGMPTALVVHNAGTQRVANGLSIAERKLLRRALAIVHAPEQEAALCDGIRGVNVVAARHPAYLRCLRVREAPRSGRSVLLAGRAARRLNLAEGSQSELDALAAALNLTLVLAGAESSEEFGTDFASGKSWVDAYGAASVLIAPEHELSVSSTVLEALVAGIPVATWTAPLQPRISAIHQCPEHSLMALLQLAARLLDDPMEVDFDPRSWNCAAREEWLEVANQMIRSSTGKFWRALKLREWTPRGRGDHTPRGKDGLPLVGETN